MVTLKRSLAASPVPTLPLLADDSGMKRFAEPLASLHRERDNLVNRLAVFELRKLLSSPELQRSSEYARSRRAHVAGKLRAAEEAVDEAMLGEASSPATPDDHLPPATILALRLCRGDIVERPKQQEEVARLSWQLSKINEGIAALNEARAELKGHLSLAANHEHLPQLRKASVGVYVALVAVAEAIDAENAVLVELIAAGYEPLAHVLRDDLAGFTQHLNLGNLGSLSNPASLISKMRELLRDQGRLP